VLSPTPAHRRVHGRARGVLGRVAPRQRRRAGTRELIDVLLLHRHIPAAAVVAGIRAALSVGSVLAEVVASKPAAPRRLTPRWTDTDGTRIDGDGERRRSRNAV
jgi:hypothetical protein